VAGKVFARRRGNRSEQPGAVTADPLPELPATPRRVVRCRRCDRRLEDATSRLYGEGERCREQVPPEPRGWRVEQDTIPGM
jgi:hypothetical protein